MCSILKSLFAKQFSSLTESILILFFLQIVPLRPPPNEILLERSVFINGSQEQIDSAQEMVNEIVREVSVYICIPNTHACFIHLYLHVK